MSRAPTGVLFVCLGNICRSPLAEGVFAHLAERRGVRAHFEVDSCGTGGWHAGEPSDLRATAVALRHGIRLTRVARQLNPERDFGRFHHLIAMDRSNARHLLEAGAPRDRVRLLRSFVPDDAHDLDVPDPYYGGDDGFETVYRIIERSCAAALSELAPADGPPTPPLNRPG